MDDDTFDYLSKILARTIDRRRTLAGLLGAVAGGLGVARPSTAAAAGVWKSCALQEFPTEDTSFVGKDITADVEFFEALAQIDACANNVREDDENFRVHINSSYRDPESNNQAGGAKGSAHLVGHAIDFRLLYTNRSGQVVECRGAYKQPGVGCLGQPFPQLPAAVQQFIRCVRNQGLRWGGDFPREIFDPVHIDDGLTAKRDPKHYKERRRWTLSSAKCAKGETCDTVWDSPTFGKCVCGGTVCKRNQTCDPSTRQCVCSEESTCPHIGGDQCCAEDHLHCVNDGRRCCQTGYPNYCPKGGYCCKEGAECCGAPGSYTCCGKGSICCDKGDYCCLDGYRHCVGIHNGVPLCCPTGFPDYCPRSQLCCKPDWHCCDGYCCPNGCSCAGKNRCDCSQGARSTAEEGLVKGDPGAPSRKASDSASTRGETDGRAIGGSATRR